VTTITLDPNRWEVNPRHVITIVTVVVVVVVVVVVLVKATRIIPLVCSIERRLRKRERGKTDVIIR